MSLKRRLKLVRRERRKAGRIASRPASRDIMASGDNGDLQFAASNELEATGGEFSLLAADTAQGDKPGPRKFKMTAYTGGLLDLAGYDAPVVVDLAGMHIAKKSRPILRDHQASQIVGHTTEVTNNGSSLTLTGVLSGSNGHALEVQASAEAGFPWEASIGVRRTAPLQFVPAGQQIRANSRTFNGPVYLAPKTVFRETSFVAIGADRGGASAALTASHQSPPAQGRAMNFAAWLKAKGFDEATLNDTQKATLKAAYEAEIAAAAAGDDDADDTLAAGSGNDDGDDDADPQAAIQAAVDAGVTQFRQATAAERRRVHLIEACAEQHGVTEIGINAAGEYDPNSQTRVPFVDHAITAGWNHDRIQLVALQAGRPTTNQLRRATSQSQRQALVIEAAMCLAIGMPADMPVRDAFGRITDRPLLATGLPDSDRQQVLNAAMEGSMRSYSLHALMDEVIAASGNAYRGSRKTDAFIRAAITAERTLQASGFSTISLPGILSNVANKAMLAKYQEQETTWQSIAAVGSNSDFKVSTRYRLHSSGNFKKVAPDGELKHVGLSENSYTSQLDTYGAMISLTRQMMINDDLNAFADLPGHIGTMAAMRVEEGVYVLLLSNPSSFFASGNRNLTSGGGSALSSSSLTTVKTKFRNQVTPNNKPLLATPRILLVPTTLEVTAQTLLTSVNDPGGALADLPNPHRGTLQQITSPWLNNTNILDQDGAAISGQSDTAWYVLCDPKHHAAIRVVFLNGQRLPTIESSDTEFQTLGMQWRGFLDFGMGMEDPNAAQKSAGA